ncbi:hypothetical protein LBMAG57_27720 [Verrucomicrobiota bacterium]|nr:hypothetical protein LBMAG57_27720 [Verrucomicrobiota bacterium]
MAFPADFSGGAADTKVEKAVAMTVASAVFYMCGCGVFLAEEEGSEKRNPSEIASQDARAGSMVITEIIYKS